MEQSDYSVAERLPTSTDLRTALLARANEFAELTKSADGTKPSLSALGVKTVNDWNFLLDVERGNNFTVDRYQRAMDWFDANWPSETANSA